MQSGLSSINAHRNSKQTFYILLIDDSGPLRSSLARQIMLSCTTHKFSCALFRLGERSEPTLTYFDNPDKRPVDPNEVIVPDFAVYEASSPRHALSWIQHAQVNYLTIISDVLMPIDTEVGLGGLINELNRMQVAVNLLFASSEAQSRIYIQPLITEKQAFFVVKGSDEWNRLPDALVLGAGRFTYKVPTHQNEAAFGPQFGRPPLPSRATAAPPAPVRQIISAPVQPEPEDYVPPPEKPLSLWDKIKAFFRGG
jgi:hypothetical protein